MALGAAAGDIRGMVMKQTLRLVAVGGLLGLAGGAVLGRLSSVLLYRVSPSDPLTFAAVTGALTAVALLAAYAPVRRAVSVDPLTALRAE